MSTWSITLQCFADCTVIQLRCSLVVLLLLSLFAVAVAVVGVVSGGVIGVFGDDFTVRGE